MTYYAIQHKDGRYFDGGEKLTNPPIPCLGSENPKDALVWRNPKQAERKMSKLDPKYSADLSITTLDSTKCNWLAD